MTAVHPRWWHFSHGADIGVAGSGGSLAEAFEQAAQALTAVVTEAPVQAIESVTIHCEAPDREFLFVDWLNALVYEMATRHLLFGRFEVTVTDAALTAQAWGETVDPDRHQPAVEVKAATYTDLSVVNDGHGTWTAQCVLDV